MARITDKETLKTIKIVELNNKTRQGKYIYIREKGYRGSYYKYDVATLEPYIEYYQKTQIEKDKTTKIQTYKDYYQEKTPKKKVSQKQIKKYEETLKKRGSIHNALQRGTATQTINQIKPSNERILDITKNLVRSLAKNKKEKNVTIISRNIHKLKRNLYYHIKINGIANNTGTTELLGEIKQVGKYTPTQLIHLLNNTLLQKDNEITSKKWDGTIMKLKLNQENTKRKYYNGTIKNVEINITLRK